MHISEVMTILAKPNSRTNRCQNVSKSVFDANYEQIGQSSKVN